MIEEQAGSGFAAENNASSAKSFNEFIGVPEGSPGAVWFGHNLFGDMKNFFDGMRDQYEQNYQTYLTNNQREYEQKQINDARAFNEYMDSTKYQRMIKDLRAAGLNPWLAVQNGIGNSSVNPGSASYSTSAMKHKVGSKDKTDDIITSALKILGVLAAV